MRVTLPTQRDLSTVELREVGLAAFRTTPWGLFPLDLTLEAKLVVQASMRTTLGTEAVLLEPVPHVCGRCVESRRDLLDRQVIGDERSELFYVLSAEALYKKIS
jgi:hypothetical protein